MDSNRPCSIDQHSNLAPRLSGKNCKFFKQNLFCLSIPKTDLDTKKTPPNREVCPESLGIAMFEYSYIEGGLFIHIQTSRSKIITEIVTRMLILSTRFMQHNTVKRNWALLWGLYFRGDVNHNCSHRASRNDALSLQGLSKVCLFSQMIKLANSSAHFSNTQTTQLYFSQWVTWRFWT